MPIATLTSTITSVIGDHGLYAVFALMAVDAVLPVASELIMVYAGALAAGAFAGQGVVLFGWEIPTGFQSYLAMALAGTIGYTLGSVGGWAIGLYGGRPLVERHGKWLHITPAKLDRAEGWFDRWGGWAVFLGRVTPVLRSFISIPAGVVRMPLMHFTVLTLLGSAMWAFALAGVGWGMGSSYERFHEDFRYADYAIAGAVLIVGIVLVVRWRRGRSTKIEDSAADTAR